MAETLYALPLAPHKANGVDIGSICWGSCGRGLVGGLGLGDYGEAIPCATPSGECPHFEKEMPKPMGTIEFNGREYTVILRKISATPRAEASR